MIFLYTTEYKMFLEITFQCRDPLSDLGKFND